MKKELLTYKDPKSPVSEVFRTLRTNIQFMSVNGKLKTLLVTSTFPEEGKSWITANLAVTFAQAGKKVLLIDADMRKGRQFNIFEVSPRPGLSNYLSNMDENNMETSEVKIKDYIQETAIENLDILVAGNVPPNPSELLISDRMTELLKKLKTKYDLVMIDGTPCDLVTDAVILSRIVDSTLVVTAQKETKKDNLVRVVKNIKNVGGNVCGIVVNKIDISTKKYSKSYYYGSTALRVSSTKGAGIRKLKSKMSNFMGKMKNKKLQKENQKMYARLATQERQRREDEEKRKIKEEQEKILAEKRRLEESERRRAEIERQKREIQRQKEDLEEQKRVEDFKKTFDKEQEERRLEKIKQEEEKRLAKLKAEEEKKAAQLRAEEEAKIKAEAARKTEEEIERIKAEEAKKREEELAKIREKEERLRQEKIAKIKAEEEAKRQEIERQKYADQLNIEQLQIKNENIIDKNTENVVKNVVEDLDDSESENQKTQERNEKAEQIMKQVNDYVRLEMQKQERKY